MDDPIIEITPSTTQLFLTPTPLQSNSSTDKFSTSDILDTIKSTHKFFHTVRGLTILFSIIILATLILVSIGFLFCCCLKRFKKVKTINKYDSIYGGTEQQQQYVVGSSGGGESRAGSWKKLQESTTSSGSGKKLLVPHKNIITPDKNLPFVVPMISLHQTGLQQGPSMAGPSSIYFGGKSSVVNSPTATANLPPMLEEQYFPQYHLEDTTTPQIGFSISYHISSQVLKVRIIGGNNFPYEIEGACYSVHVKVYPGRGSKQRTKEFPGSSPTYNQEFSFHVRKDTLRTKVLKMRVIGQNFSINTPTSTAAATTSGSGTSGGASSVSRVSSFIGSSSISSHGSTLSGVSSNSGGKTLVGIISIAIKDLLPPVNQNEEIKQDFKTGPIWKMLEHPSSYGEGIKLEVSLKWAEEPVPGLLVMKIREAYGLHEITEAEYTTTYVKVTLQEQGRSIKNRKTRLIRWGSQPNYDDTFVVTIPYELLSQISFTLSLIARGRLGSKVILGKINVGPVPYVNPQSGFAAGSEIWEDMIHQKNVEVCRWLPLMMA